MRGYHTCVCYFSFFCWYVCVCFRTFAFVLVCVCLLRYIFVPVLVHTIVFIFLWTNYSVFLPLSSDCVVPLRHTLFPVLSIIIDPSHFTLLSHTSTTMGRGGEENGLEWRWGEVVGWRREVEAGEVWCYVCMQYNIPQGHSVNTVVVANLTQHLRLVWRHGFTLSYIDDDYLVLDRKIPLTERWLGFYLAGEGERVEG